MKPQNNHKPVIPEHIRVNQNYGYVVCKPCRIAIGNTNSGCITEQDIKDFLDAHKHKEIKEMV